MWDQILHPFAVAIAWVWVKIHDLLVLIGLGSGSGFAWVLSIVLLTLVVRALILPLFYRQIKSSRGMQAMQPELKKIQEKYKGKTDTVSRQKMAEESQALYKKHGTSPFASCLPLLVQMPILFAMYRAIFAVKDIALGTYSFAGKPADSLGPITQAVASEIDGSTVLGVPLSNLLTTPGNGVMGIAAFIIMIIVMVVMQFLSLRLTMTRNMPPQADPDNPMVRSQRMMMYVMPVMFIFTGFFFQMGLLVYMVTTTAWSWGQSLWTVKYMPTPGSPAYIDLVAKRQGKYQEWAKPFFADYDRDKAALAASDTEGLAALNARTLAEVKKRAKAQRIASNFPAEMTDGEVLGVYRALSTQEWDTLPDEQWMRAIKRATEKAVERRAQQSGREQNRRLSREQRKAERQAAIGASADASPSNEGEAASRSDRSAGGVELTPEEIERRRQARKKAHRQGKKRRR